MNLLKEIRLNFAAKKEGMRKLENIPNNYSAWTFKINNNYGVAVENKKNKSIIEKFANSKIMSRVFIDNNGNELNMIVLSCDKEDLRREFASICAYFVDPGKNGELRYELLNNPLEWWEKWKKLIGNAIIDKKPYSVLGELLALEHLIKEGEYVKWTGPNSSIYDIESINSNYEVKSTIQKYQSQITISSQFQLDNKKDLYLYFCRLEKGIEGESIDSVVERLVGLGYSRTVINEQLERVNMDIGSCIRKEKYIILEKRKYIVNSSFPKITKESFTDGRIPESIVKITYTIDLDGITYSLW